MKLLFAVGQDVLEGDVSAEQARALSSIVGRALRLLDLRMRYGKNTPSGDRILSLGLESGDEEALTRGKEQLREAAVKEIEAELDRQKQVALDELDKKFR